MYMNRLRHDDFLALFDSNGHRILATDPAVDTASLALLNDGRLHVDARFGGKAAEVLATTASWIISSKQC
jgi:hypothetical protein